MKDRESIKWLFMISKKQIPKIIFVSITNAMLAIIGIVIALLSKKVIDAAVYIAKVPVGQEKDYTNLIVFGLLMFFTILVRLALSIVTQSMTVKAQARLEMGIKTRLFQSILEKNYSEISKYHSGELMNRLISDVGIISDGVVSIVPNTTYLIFQFVGAMIVLVSFDWRFTFVFVLGGIFILIIASLLRNKLKNLHKKVQQTDGKVRAFFQETIESILVVKTFGIEEEVRNKGEGFQNANYDAKMKRRSVSIGASAGFGFVFYIGYMYALIWCSLKLCRGAMSYGTLTAILQLISQVQTPVVNFTKIFPQIFGIVASAERIREIENIVSEKEIYGNGPDIDVEDTYSRLEKIAFENVKFGYGRDVVLEGGSAEINKGDFVAIRGISGIGKSTLLKMLLGVFMPKDGKIVLKLTDGTEIDASVKTRDLFSYVPQGNFLFSGTLRENLYLVNAEATDKEIEEALVISDSKGFVAQLPQGLETVIGEKGLGLSEGQVQRIAIARAVLCKAPIVLLDEATSALDEKTEERVLDNIKKMKNKTCIIITHKVAALNVCNRELKIEDKMLSEKVK